MLINSGGQHHAPDKTGASWAVARANYDQYASPTIGGSGVALGAGAGMAECEKRCQTRIVYKKNK